MRDRVPLWIFLTFTLLYLCTGRGHFIVTSEINDFQTARSLWNGGGLAVGFVLGSLPGRDGRRFSPHGIGQAVAAAPLYGLGKLVRESLQAHARDDWVEVFAGPSIGTEPSRWGGDAEIFFVSLLNSVVAALVCAVYYGCARDLGAPVASALAATLLLGLTSYLAALSAGFLTHPSDMLFLLLAVRALMRNARKPSATARAWAGAWMGVMLNFRAPSALAWPALWGYLLWSVRAHARRDGRSTAAAAAHELPAFVLPLLMGVLVHSLVMYAKFGTPFLHLDPNDPTQGFRTPLLTGLFGLLLSPGTSIFLFTPLLVLTPWLYRDFWRTQPAEAALCLALAASFLLVCARFTSWHGLTDALGPRYLSPVVPVLLLPLGPWLGAAGRRAWFAVAPLAALGLFVQILALAVNFSYVYYYARYGDYVPPASFLFIPDVSPLVEHWRALRAWDYRVDVWLLNVYRAFGPGRFLAVAVPLMAALGACAWRLARAAGDAAASE